MPEPEPTPEATATVILVSTDLLAASQFEGATRAAGAELVVLGPAKLQAAVEASPPRLVVFDLASPIMDLPGKIAWLKTQSPAPAVVAFGPHVQEAKLNAAAEAGCDAVLTRGQFHRSAADVVRRYASA